MKNTEKFFIVVAETKVENIDQAIGVFQACDMPPVSGKTGHKVYGPFTPFDAVFEFDTRFKEIINGHAIFFEKDVAFADMYNLEDGLYCIQEVGGYRSFYKVRNKIISQVKFESKGEDNTNYYASKNNLHLKYRMVYTNSSVLDYTFGVEDKKEQVEEVDFSELYEPVNVVETAKEKMIEAVEKHYDPNPEIVDEVKSYVQERLQEKLATTKEAVAEPVVKEREPEDIITEVKIEVEEPCGSNSYDEMIKKVKKTLSPVISNKDDLEFISSKISMETIRVIIDYAPKYRMRQSKIARLFNYLSDLMKYRGISPNITTAYASKILYTVEGYLVDSKMLHDNNEFVDAKDSRNTFSDALNNTEVTERIIEIDDVYARNRSIFLFKLYRQMIEWFGTLPDDVFKKIYEIDYDALGLNEYVVRKMMFSKDNLIKATCTFGGLRKTLFALWELEIEITAAIEKYQEEAAKEEEPLVVNDTVKEECDIEFDEDGYPILEVPVEKKNEEKFELSSGKYRYIPIPRRKENLVKHFLQYCQRKNLTKEYAESLVGVPYENMSDESQNIVLAYLIPVYSDIERYKSIISIVIDMAPNGARYDEMTDASINDPTTVISLNPYYISIFIGLLSLPRKNNRTVGAISINASTRKKIIEEYNIKHRDLAKKFRCSEGLLIRTIREILEDNCDVFAPLPSVYRFLRRAFELGNPLKAAIELNIPADLFFSKYLKENITFFHKRGEAPFHRDPVYGDNDGGELEQKFVREVSTFSPAEFAEKHNCDLQSVLDRLADIGLTYDVISEYHKENPEASIYDIYVAIKQNRGE